MNTIHCLFAFETAQIQTNITYAAHFQEQKTFELTRSNILLSYLF